MKSKYLTVDLKPVKMLIDGLDGNSMEIPMPVEWKPRTKEQWLDIIVGPIKSKGHMCEMCGNEGQEHEVLMDGGEKLKVGLNCYENLEKEQSDADAEILEK